MKADRLGKIKCINLSAVSLGVYGESCGHDSTHHARKHPLLQVLAIDDTREKEGVARVDQSVRRALGRDVPVELRPFAE